MYMPVHVATAKVMYAQKQLQQSQISHIAVILKIKLTKNTCTYILMREKMIQYPLNGYQKVHVFFH